MDEQQKKWQAWNARALVEAAEERPPKPEKKDEQWTKTNSAKN